jgi:hypothetical protein
MSGSSEAAPPRATIDRHRIDTEAILPLRGSSRECYPGLRLKSLLSDGQVLSIAADSDQPLTLRLVPPQDRGRRR